MGLLLLICVFPPRVAAWSEFGLEEGQNVATAEGPEIREPFFAFLLGIAQVDSLGSWTGAQLQEHANAAERESRFPLDQVVSLTRTRPDSAGSVRYAGTQVLAVWRIELAAAQDRPMPYSILGYHPGSLRIAAELVLSELAAFDLNLSYTEDGAVVGRTVTEVRVFVLKQGYVVLDADGWLDALLGAGLDDSWILGFVTGREDGRLLGLGVSVGRKGRPIYGEFDFANDKVLAHGRPLVNALSQASRSRMTAAGTALPTPWEYP